MVRLLLPTYPAACNPLLSECKTFTAVTLQLARLSKAYLASSTCC